MAKKKITDTELLKREEQKDVFETAEAGILDPTEKPEDHQDTVETVEQAGTPEPTEKLDNPTLAEDNGPPTAGRVIMTIGEDRPGHNLVQASVGIISPATARQQQPDTNLVLVKIKYPDKYGKQKLYKDGFETEVSRESANQFVAAGIATIIERDKPEQ